MDWLRIAAFALLVLYHVGMLYVSWDFHVKSPLSPSTGKAIEPFMQLSSPWRMSLLFFISGAATALMLASQGQAQGGTSFMRQRSRRLLWPLLFGVVVLVPAQSYFEVQQQHGWGGGFIAFLPLYFTAYSGFCKAGHCLILPTWNHLWFLPYLWIYTLLLWWLARRWPIGFERIANGAQVALQSGSLLRGLGGPILFLALMRWLLYPRFGSTHALVDDLYNHSIYLPVFFAGAVAATRQDIFQRFATWRWAALVLALLSWTVFTSLQGGQAQIREQLPGLAPTLMAALGPTYALAWASMQWAAVVAALGFARQHLNGEHPWRAPLTEAVFPVYLLHQTLLICLAVWLFPLGWPPAIEGPVIVVLTFTGCLLLWRVTRNVSFLRTPMGIEIKAPSAPAASVIK